MVKSECEQLHDIAVSIIQTSKINVIIDNALPTAMTDYKNIFVTINLIPPELRKYRRVVSRLLDGQVAHESGHIVVTSPVKQAQVKWIDRQSNKQLANIVHQSLEDKRVDFYILSRYRFDFAYRLQLLRDVTTRLWVDTLKQKMAERRNSSTANAMRPEEYFINEFLIPISEIKGLTGFDVESEFQMNAEQKAFVHKVSEIYEDARFDKMVMSVLKRHQELYDLWETQVNRTGEEPERNTPAGQGGELKLISGQTTKRALQQMEKQLKKAEEEAEAERKKQNMGKDDKNPSGGMYAGAGSGLNIPTPIPNAEEYERIVQKNREHIERLLNLLKKLALPILDTEKWLGQGRFMTEILAKAYASSTVRRIENIYSRRTLKFERAEACIGLLVDLSGSVSEEDAKNSLTVISEVCGRWLRDEDFAILVFGSDYQKIKAFVEPYHTTRIRIGGIHDLGGTVLLKPLEEMYQMIKAQKNGGRAKIITIVSDFWVDKPDECKKLLKTIQEDEVKVVGLGIDNSSVAQITPFTKNARYIGSIVELPEAVFDLYREVAL